MYRSSSVDEALAAIAARRAQRLIQRVTWISDRLGLSEPPIVNAAYLRQLPLGTFGRTWIDTLDGAGLAPLDRGPRRQQLHDGIHVLTGYGTDPLGEAQVQAFLMGAKFRLIHGIVLSPMVIAVTLSKSVARHVGQSDQFTVRTMLHDLKQAYQRGRRSQLDPDRWQPENLWHLPLADVKIMFRV